ncbi:MAG: mechanosensitive ion channel family protein [Gammaproteobacteria bacterium]|nr:MAG: mechanosensitive ion channel family protein [Gammaproteobacteria bacterium]
MFTDILSKTFYGNTALDWFIAISIIIGAIVVGKILYWFSKNVFKKLAAKTETRLDDIIIDMIEEPVVFAIIISGIWIALNTLNTTKGMEAFTSRVFYILIIFCAAWLLVRLIDSLFKEYIVPLAAKTESNLDDQLVPMLRKSIKTAIWVIAIIVGLDNAGYDVATLLAGLGIGGLAFALAAQDTISNLFGGFTILADKPFKINDRIKISGFDGYVREIGLRSTRLVTLEGRTVTIPNSTFAKNPIENISSEPARKITLNLGLIYDTTAAELETAMTLLRNIAINDSDIEDKAKISFNAFGDFALNILFIYYIKKGNNIYDGQTAVSLEILKQFAENNLEFAFPTQTIYKKELP